MASCQLSQIPPREMLVAAIGSIRFTEGRLAGGFPFAPYSSTLPFPTLSDPALHRAAQRIERAARRGRDPQALADLAILKLLANRTDEAVSLLEEASKRAPRNARHRSDLAAAYLARARPDDLIRALAVADRAIRDGPSLPEPRFNRALALEKLSLITAARQAWQEMSQREIGSAWSHEAAQHLRRLQRTPEREIWKLEKDRLDSAALYGQIRTVKSIVDRFRQPARQYAEEDLLRVWAELTATGRTVEAERALRIARAIGNALVEIHGDAMVRDGVAVIDAARRAEPGSCLSCLVRGHRLFGEGARNVRERQIDQAVYALTEAEEQFRRSGSPFVLWARFNLANCSYFRPEYSRTKQALKHLRHALSIDHYPILRGRISYVLGSTSQLIGHPGEALTFIREAEQAFISVEEVDNIVAVHELLGLVFDNLGEPDRGLRHLLLALQLRHRAHDHRRVFAVVDLVAMNCLQRGEIEVARYFQNELLSDSLTQKIPSFVSFAHQRRARTFYLAGLQQKALRDLDDAARQARAIPDPGIRRRQQAEILTLRGEVQILGQPAAAVHSLSQAIAFFERAGLGYYLSSALFIRARAELALGDEAGADRDFRRGLLAIERARNSSPPGSLRMTLYDQATTLFDEILSFHARRGAGDRAFEISERVRARQLLDRSAPAGKILGLREIQRRLPEGTVLLKYVLLPDRLLVWALDKNGAELRQVSLDTRAFTAQVEQVGRLIRRREPGPALGILLRDLHHTLLTPVASRFHGARVLVVVPDKILHLLPFAALMDRGTGKYLVQDFALSVAPSANVYVRCLGQASAQDLDPPISALIVAANEFDRTRFPSFDTLPQVEEEARLIAAAYPQSRLLTGREATRERFLALASQGPEVIHFAGHALVNADHPDLSMLVLAGNGGKDDSTAVYSYEVDRMELGATRLVVLSACSTAAGRLSATEGATSLARSFLAARTPAVLASLWEVDDAVSSRLMTKLHHRLRTGDDPITALRAIQLSELGTAPLADWAAFQLIGGGLPPQLQKGRTHGIHGRADDPWTHRARSQRAHRLQPAWSARRAGKTRTTSTYQRHDGPRNQRPESESCLKQCNPSGDSNGFECLRPSASPAIPTRGRAQ